MATRRFIDDSAAFGRLVQSGQWANTEAGRALGRMKMMAIEPPARIDRGFGHRLSGRHDCECDP